MNTVNDLVTNGAQIIGAVYALATALNGLLRIFGFGGSPIVKALDRVSLSLEPAVKPAPEKAS